MPIIDKILFWMVGAASLVFFVYLLIGDGRKKAKKVKVLPDKATPMVWEENYWNVIEETKEVYGKGR